MRSIMNKGIIKGPFLLLLFLIISSRTNWRHQCEAASVIAIPDSRSVSNEPNNMTNNPISISPENKTTTLVLPVTHSKVDQLQPESLVNDIIIVEDNISIAQRSLPVEPCPIANHSMRNEDAEGKQKEKSNVKEGRANHENGDDKNGPGSSSPVKQEEHVETALEKISEGISGVFTSLKNSVASIFSPGTGIPDSGRLDCHNESINLSAGGVEKNTSLANSTDDENLSTSGTGSLGKEKEGLLIPSVSTNDTNNNTNETNTSITTTSTTTLLPTQESSTEAVGVSNK